MLCHVIGVQNENKIALINPPSWIFPRSVVNKRSWGELNLPTDLPVIAKGDAREVGHTISDSSQYLACIMFINLFSACIKL